MINIKNFFHSFISRKALVTYTFIVVIGGVLVGIFATGISKKESDYDVIITTQKVNSMNYITATGQTQDLLTPSIEGLLVSSNNDQRTLNTLNPDFWDLTIPEAKATYDALLVGMGYHLNQAGELVQDGTELKTVSAINMGETFNSNKEAETYDVVTDLDFTMSYATDIYKNNDSSQYRFYLRDDGYWNTGEKVKPSDFAFGWKISIDPNNGSPTSYLLTDFSSITGFGNLFTKLSVPNLSIEQKTQLYSSVFYDVDLRGWPANPNDYGVLYSNNEGWIQTNLYESNSVLYSMLSLNSFFPINEEFVKRNGITTSAEYGTSTSTSSWNGAYEISSFDASYGITMSKNDNYYAAEAVIPNTILFRFVDEATTEGTLFSSGYSSKLTSSNSALAQILAAPEVSKYIPSQNTSAGTEMMTWNLSKVNNSANSKFIKNPNFRKAVSYAFNRTYIQNAAGSPDSLPQGEMTAMNLDSYSNNGTTYDFVDLTNSTTFKPYENAIPTQVGYYSKSVREEALLKTSSELNDPSNINQPWYRGVDPRTNKELSQYFYNQFLSDMNAIGEPVPETINLKYITKLGPGDPYYRAINQGLTENVGGKIQLVPDYLTSSQFSGARSSGYNDFDIIYYEWSPDYKSPWTMYSILNTSSPFNFKNLSMGWNLWTGLTDSYGTTYDEEDMNQVLSWNDSGILGIVNDGYENSTKYDYLFGNADQELSYGSDISDLIRRINFININPLSPEFGTIAGNPTGSIDITIDDSFLYKDNVSVCTPTETIWNNQDCYDIAMNETEYSVKGAESSSLWSLPDVDRSKLFMMMEILLQDSASIIPINNETRINSPSRLTFDSTSPSIGHANLAYAFDVRKAPEWAPNEKDIIN